MLLLEKQTQEYNDWEGRQEYLNVASTANLARFATALGIEAEETGYAVRLICLMGQGKYAREVQWPKVERHQRRLEISSRQSDDSGGSEDEAGELFWFDEGESEDEHLWEDKKAEVLAWGGTAVRNFPAVESDGPERLYDEPLGFPASAHKVLCKILKKAKTKRSRLARFAPPFSGWQAKVLAITDRKNGPAKNEGYTDAWNNGKKVEYPPRREPRPWYG